jgi:hypothetical protein
MKTEERGSQGTQMNKSIRPGVTWRFSLLNGLSIGLGADFSWNKTVDRNVLASGFVTTTNMGVQHSLRIPGEIKIPFAGKGFSFSNAINTNINFITAFVRRDANDGKKISTDTYRLSLGFDYQFRQNLMARFSLNGGFVKDHIEPTRDFLNYDLMGSVRAQF